MASSPSIALDSIFAAAPATTRGQPTHLSTDGKGQRIAYASGKSIFIRSIDSPDDCKEYTAHTAPTTVARFAPNGFKIASADAAGTLRIWEPQSPDRTGAEYAIVSGRLSDVAWDGDSQRLMAVGDGRDQFGRCITADTGNSVGDVIGHSKTINAVAMRLQRPFRAATVADDGSLVFYHGAPYKFSHKTDNVHRGFVFDVAYSPDGDTLVSVGADRRIQLYDGKTGEPGRHIGDGDDAHAGSIFAVAWSQDGTKIVTASADQTVKLWHVEQATLLQTWRFGNGVSVGHQQVGVVIPHGRTDGLIISLNLKGELTYLRQGQSEPIRVIQGHDKGITAMVSTSNPNGSALWTGSFDGRICHWDVTTGTAATVEGQSHTNQVAQLATVSGKVLSAGWDDMLRTVDESTKSFLGDGVTLPAQPKGVAAADDDGLVYVATTTGVVIYSKGSLLKEISTSFTPSAIAATKGFVAVGAADQNSVQVYETDGGGGGGLRQVQSLSNSTGSISALAFSRDGTHLAAGNSVGKIYVYGKAAGGDGWELVTERWSAHTARVTCIAWDETGAYAASGSLDTNVFVWCLEKKSQGKRIKAANAHKDGVRGVAWIGGGRVASAGHDAAVKVWKVENLA